MTMKKLLISLVVGIVILFPVWAGAQGLNSAGSNLAKVTKGTGLSGDLEGTAAVVITTALSLVGTIFLGLTIYAGIRWMTAQGAEEKVTKAKNTMEAAIIGLVITLLAYAITSFVTNRLTGNVSVKGDEKCTAQGGVCGPSASCTIGEKVPNLCLSNPDKDYICCVPNNQ